MSDSVDRILQAIDTGLQTPMFDPTYTAPINHDRCARCQYNPRAEDGDLCTGCRAYLLGDTDNDPRSAPGMATSAALVDLGIVVPVLQDECTGADCHVCQQVEDFGRQVAEARAADLRTDLVIIDEVWEERQPEATQRERRHRVWLEGAEQVIINGVGYRFTNRGGGRLWRRRHVPRSDR